MSMRTMRTETLFNMQYQFVDDYFSGVFRVIVRDLLTKKES